MSAWWRRYRWRMLNPFFFLGRFLDALLFWLPQGRPERLDHGRMYLMVIIAVFITATSMLVIGPIPNSTISELSYETQTWLAMAMWFGSLMCLIGTLLGTKACMPNIDIRICYMMGLWGVPALSVSMGTYTFAIFNTYQSIWLSALGGSFSFFVVLGSLWNALDFRAEIKNIETRMGLLRTLETQERRDTKQAIEDSDAASNDS